MPASTSAQRRPLAVPRSRRARTNVPNAPSVREVRLIGLAGSPEPRAVGERLSWSGRAYSVAASQTRRGAADELGNLYLLVTETSAMEPNAG